MSDYTNIIQEINTNIPDNTDQSITALKVRTTLIDMLDAVDDNMTEAIGEISVPTKTSDLTNDSGFITATSLEPYVTKTELSNASYVTQNELNSASYVTESQLQQAGYATTAFVDDAIADAFEDSDFMTETDVNNLLSTASYVTSEQLSAIGYITNQDLEQTLSSATYVSQSDISNMGYVTGSEIAASGYITQTELSNMSYATTSQLSGKQDTLVSGTNIKTINNESLLGSGNIVIEGGGDLSAYVSKEELSQMGYVTSTALSNMSYATTSDLNNAIAGIDIPTYTSDLTNDSGFITASDLSGYATETYVANYVSQHTPTPDLSAYVSKVELSSMGYITANDLPDMSSYATLTYLETYYATLQNVYDTEDAMQQVLIDANILVSDPETGDWTTQVMASETYVVDYVATYAPTPDLSAYVTKTELSNASYVTQSALNNMSYVTASALSNMSYATTTQVNAKQDALVSGTNIKTINNESLLGSGNITIAGGGSTVTGVTQAQYDAMEQAGTLDPTVLYVITDATGVDLSDYVELTYLETYYADKTYVADYVATYAPMPDLSAYVTKTELSNAGYLTAIPSEYVTESELSGMSYATTSQLADKQDTLVSGTNIKTVNNNSLLGSGNISITSTGNLISEVTQAEYDAMEQAGTLDPDTIYVITDAAPTDLSYYVTKTELSNAGYLTSIPNTYATYAAISNMGYLTSANFIYDSSTYTLTISI